MATGPVLQAKLNDGRTMPFVGLGVYQTEPGPATQAAVRSAIQVGYRSIDTAKFYQNESDVGQVVRESRVPRGEFFITTKLGFRDHGHQRALSAFAESEQKLGLGYVDLYLVHWPGGGPGTDPWATTGLRRESWKAMESLLGGGKCRSIGVSNYTIAHLEELLRDSPVVPAVNQVEFHPWLYQKELLEFCHRHRIQLEAYTPLADARFFDDPVLREISARHARTPAQVLLRWGIQHDVVVIPKSVREARIRENFGLFDFSLGPAEMQRLDGLDQGLRTRWDPTGVQ